MTSTSEQFAYYVCDSVRQRQTNILTSPLLYSCCVLVPLMLLLQHYIINNDILTNINNYICYLYVCATHSAEYDVFPRYIWWSARRMDTLLDTNPTTKVCVRQDAKTNSGLLFGFGQSFFSRIARSFARNVGQADHPSGGQRAVRPCRTSETEYNGSQVQGTLIQMIDWFSFSLNNWSILLNQGRPRPRLHCSLLTRQWSQDKVFCQQRMSDWWCFLSKLEKKAVEVKPRRISLHQTTTKSMLCKDCICFQTESMNSSKDFFGWTGVKIDIMYLWLWTRVNDPLCRPGFYRNPGVKQSRSSRFGHRRTEEDALKIVLSWMDKKHKEAQQHQLIFEWLVIRRYFCRCC